MTRVGGDPVRTFNNHASSNAIVHAILTEIDFGIMGDDSVRLADLLQVQDERIEFQIEVAENDQHWLFFFENGFQLHDGGGRVFEKTGSFQNGAHGRALASSNFK